MFRIRFARIFALALAVSAMAATRPAPPSPDAPTSGARARGLFLEARSRERAGDDSAALALYRQAYRNDPGNRDLCFMVLERIRFADPTDSAYAFGRRCATLEGKAGLSEYKALGELALRAEDDKGALDFYRKAHALDEDDGDVLYVLAGLYEDARDWESYAAVARPLIRRLGYPAALVERLLRADAFLDRPDSALALLKDAWRETDRLAYGQALANYYDGRDMHQSLLEVARALAATQPSPESDWLLARAYAAADRPDSALQVSKRLLSSLPDSDAQAEGVRYFQAGLWFDQGRYAEAYAAAAALAKARPEAASILYLKGSSALELRKREARPLLEKALALAPLSPDYRARLAYAEYAVKGASRPVPACMTYAVSDSLKPEQARMLEGFAHGQLARMLDPREPWERRAVLSDTALARRHRLIAIDRFEEVLGGDSAGADTSIGPGKRAALFELASHLDKAGSRARAKALLRRLIARDSTQAMALNYLGYMLVENLPVDSAELREAGELLDRAVAIEPENGAYLDSRGWWFFRKGEPDSARVALESAARSIPSDPSILEHLAEVYQALGRPGEACAAWRGIIARDPRRTLPPGCPR